MWNVHISYKCYIYIYYILINYYVTEALILLFQKFKYKVTQ